MERRSFLKFLGLGAAAAAIAAVVPATADAAPVSTQPADAALDAASTVAPEGEFAQWYYRRRRRRMWRRRRVWRRRRYWRRRYW